MARNRKLMVRGNDLIDEIIGIIVKAYASVAR